MTLVQALLAWLVLFVVAFANGLLRAVFLKTYLGDLRAHQVSCGIGIVLITAAVWLLSRRWRFLSTAQAWRTGLLWLALTVAWEFLFFHFVFGSSWALLLQDYALWQGRLWVLVLATILLAPVLIHARDQAPTRP